ncbi:hypothetical protein [Curtobacterium sp. MCJR17_043]|uniref:hypothetical protein n=1 Tax=Curtobacterium sp. MCJR17_043 TaxID=2175660 RepID=UPI0024DFC766|nr:hypothetical protein [Curtobacterium sp. MCJR17_043]WIB34773.1 hypothetical protein DEJ15_09260 [Curtobacterium sp. MCJR17_043]
MNGLRQFAPTVLVAALGTTFGSALVIAPGIVTEAMAMSPLDDVATVKAILSVIGWLFLGIALYVGAIVTANTCATLIAGQTRVIALQRLVGATGGVHPVPHHPHRAARRAGRRGRRRPGRHGAVGGVRDRPPRERLPAGPLVHPRAVGARPAGGRGGPRDLGRLRRGVAPRAHGHPARGPVVERRAEPRRRPVRHSAQGLGDRPHVRRRAPRRPRARAERRHPARRPAGGARRLRLLRRGRRRRDDRHAPRCCRRSAGSARTTRWSCSPGATPCVLRRGPPVPPSGSSSASRCS